MSEFLKKLQKFIAKTDSLIHFYIIKYDFNNNFIFYSLNLLS